MMLKTHLPQSRSETNFGGRGQPECHRFLACEGLGRSQIWSFSHVALLLVQQVWDSHIYDASNPNVGSRGLEQEFVHLQRQNYSTNTTQSFGFGMQSWCQRLSKGYFVAWYFSPLCDSQIGKQVSGIFFLKDIILLSTAYPSFQERQIPHLMNKTEFQNDCARSGWYHLLLLTQEHSGLQDHKKRHNNSISYKPENNRIAHQYCIMYPLSLPTVCSLAF